MLSVSIVIFHADVPTLHATLTSLSRACALLSDTSQGSSAVDLYLIDNALDGQANLVRHDPANADDFAQFASVTVIAGQGNVGYGRGHNLAILRTERPFHLVLNPDVVVSSDALMQGMSFLARHSECGLVAPMTHGPDGTMQYLCRRYPTLLDLLIRGFFPQRFRQKFATRLARYEMRDLVGPIDVFWDPPIVSGCFMLCRRSILTQIGGFDPSYFLYFEDYDLCLRLGRLARIAYVPQMTIVHYGGGASRKGWRHIMLFAASAFRFFNTHGWRLW